MPETITSGPQPGLTLCVWITLKKNKINMFLFVIISQPWDGAESLNFYLMKDLFILHSQCHCCWCPGNKGCQGIGSHGIDLVFSECFGLSTSPIFQICFIKLQRSTIISRQFSMTYHFVLLLVQHLWGYGKYEAMEEVCTLRVLLVLTIWTMFFRSV